jgi:hypothetical protein
MALNLRLSLLEQISAPEDKGIVIGHTIIMALQ